MKNYSPTGSEFDPVQVSRAPDYAYRIGAVAAALILLLTWLTA